MRILASSLLLCSLASAQLLFPVNQVPFEAPHETVEQGGSGVRWDEGGRVPKVAIIGGGAAGSSAAYFLSHFAREAGLETDVTLFEESDYIGGRSTVLWPWNDDPFEDPRKLGEPDTYEAPVELGASIFVGANLNLQKARRVFGLDFEEYGGEDGETAIWDGERWVYQETGHFIWNWWGKAKLLWRFVFFFPLPLPAFGNVSSSDIPSRSYGRSPFTVRTLVKSTVDSFVDLYSPSFVSSGAFNSLHNFSAATNLQDASSSYADEFFASHSVSPLFTNELVSAATQVNYGSPISEIHGVGALVSLAATGAVSIKGGNRRIFEEFVGRSGARLRLGKTAKVETLLKLDAEKGKRAQWIVKTAAGGVGGTFDVRFFLCPLRRRRCTSTLR